RGPSPAPGRRGGNRNRLAGRSLQDHSALFRRPAIRTHIAQDASRRGAPVRARDSRRPCARWRRHRDPALMLLPLLVAATLQLEVDATDASRNVLHARLRIPVAPGEVTLVYPKWLPGNHRPAGPIQNLTGLQITANGKRVDWRRDPVDMYAFHVQVPQGASEL